MHTHDLLRNFSTKVHKTQQVYLKSYSQKSRFIGILEYLHKKGLFADYGIDYTHAKLVFGLGSRKWDNLRRDLQDCGSWLEFAFFSASGLVGSSPSLAMLQHPRCANNREGVRLLSANFCRRDKLCPACAVRRAYKQQEKFLKALQVSPDLLDKHWYYIVIPVRHSKGETIEEVYQRLDRVRKSILMAVRNKKRGRSAGFWGKFNGGMGSIEVTKTANGWNVHLNLLVNADDPIDLIVKKTKDHRGRVKVNYINSQLMDHLKRIGDGSFVHNISKVDFTSKEDVRSNLVEVLKYALKFSSLDDLDLIRVYLAFYRRRLFFTFGNLHGLKLEQVELADRIDLNAPFLRILFRRVFRSYYLEDVRFQNVLKWVEKPEVEGPALAPGGSAEGRSFLYT